MKNAKKKTVDNIETRRTEGVPAKRTRTAENITADRIVASRSWRIVKLAQGEKFRIGKLAQYRVGFVVSGEVEVTTGLMRGLRVAGGQMGLIHFAHSRTLRALQESLLVECLLEHDGAERDVEAVIEVLRETARKRAVVGAVPYGDEVGELLRQVCCFARHGSFMNNRLDDFLRVRLARMLHEETVPVSALFDFGATTLGGMSEDLDSGEEHDDRCGDCDSCGSDCCCSHYPLAPLPAPAVSV